jgi:hypothetical protein
MSPAVTPGHEQAVEAGPMTAETPETSDHCLINHTVLEVSDYKRFEPLDSTFTFSPAPTSCPASVVRGFSFEARRTNIRERSLVAPGGAGSYPDPRHAAAQCRGQTGECGRLADCPIRRGVRRAPLKV